VKQRSKSDISGFSEVIRTLRSIAVHLLARTYRPEERMFAFRLKRNAKDEILQGVSRRYTAIALIGLASEEEFTVTQVLGNHSLKDVCEHLLKNIDQMEDLGELALTTWAARGLEHPCTHKAIDILRHFSTLKRAYPTIELSWALTALVIGASQVTDLTLAKRLAETLMDSFNKKSNTFFHGPSRKGLSSVCSHVSCFADFVYPIQALSYYYQATQDSRAAEIACCCAEHMCELQGDDGEWWWHFDNRTGRVLERFPVYSVHQDSMAPMALLALNKACGVSFPGAIEKGIHWLLHPPEISGSLIDAERNIIWRKVARREPRKLVRSLQAVLSCFHSGLRMPGMDILFPNCSIDYESRPYHMGWILHAWPNSRTTRDK
jgi:hypothetical protein